MYKATIVIPNINGKGWLKDSIESVYAQTEQNFQLIVVDNGSTDESLEQARSYCSRANFTLIENGTNTGFSHAVNQGIAMAESEYVVLFNNDAFAEPQWLAELIRTAETDPKIFAVQSLMIRHFDRELADDAGDYVTWMGFACKTGDGRRVSRYTKQKRIFSACGGAAVLQHLQCRGPGRFGRLAIVGVAFPIPLPQPVSIHVVPRRAVGRAHLLQECHGGLLAVRKGELRNEAALLLFVFAHGRTADGPVILHNGSSCVLFRISIT